MKLKDKNINFKSNNIQIIKLEEKFLKIRNFLVKIKLIVSF
jgi:hypothetical protein